MGKISTTLNIGDREDMTIEGLLEIIERLYSDLAEAVNRKPDVYERETDGQSSDSFLSNGDINLNSITNKVEILVAHTGPSSVDWSIIG